MLRDMESPIGRTSIHSLAHESMFLSTYGEEAVVLVSAVSPASMRCWLIKPRVFKAHLARLTGATVGQQNASTATPIEANTPPRLGTTCPM